MMFLELRLFSKGSEFTSRHRARMHLKRWRSSKEAVPFGKVSVRAVRDKEAPDDYPDLLGGALPCSAFMDFKHMSQQ